MLLTSYERMRRHLSAKDADNFSDSVYHKRDSLSIIQSVSKQVEHYCGREFDIRSRTEYFDCNGNEKEFFVHAPDVSTVTSVYQDPTGLYDGSEVELTDPGISVDSRSVIVDNLTALGFKAIKGVRIIYTGGLGYHASQSIFVSSDMSSAPTVGYYMSGSSSSAIGLVKAWVAGTTSLTLEVLYGEFETDETLTEYTTEGLTTASGVSGTLDSKTRTALCEAYPDLVQAVEVQCSYMYRLRNGYEQAGVTRNGDNIRDYTRPGGLQPETQALLTPYRRYRFA